jgi:glutamate decarboxylase
MSRADDCRDSVLLSLNQRAGTERSKPSSDEKADMSNLRPNLVISKSSHFIWNKFCDWFDVECREVSPEPNDIRVSASSYASHIDQQTMGVVLVMGYTLTGQYDPIRELADQLNKIEQTKGLKVPIHVDAAIGGFYTPFVDRHIVWDFRLDNVVSINLSGHKFGLTYPGIGWIIFRSKQYCPDQVRYRLDYPNAESQYNLSFNLTRSAAPVIAQYYNFLRLGRQGYSRIMLGIRSHAQYLYDSFNKQCGDVFCQLNDPSSGLPILVMTTAEGSDIQLTRLSRVLALHGLILPTYLIPYADHHIDVVRIVVREGFTRDQAEILINAVLESIDEIRVLILILFLPY